VGGVPHLRVGAQVANDHALVEHEGSPVGGRVLVLRLVVATRRVVARRRGGSGHGCALVRGVGVLVRASGVPLLAVVAAVAVIVVVPVIPVVAILALIAAALEGDN